MTKIINRGTLPNDGTGETLYSAFGDINQNFAAHDAALAKKLEPATDGSTNLPGALKINGTTVLTGQLPAVANATVGQEAATLNALLSALQSSGLMAAVAQALQALTLSATNIASGAAAGTVVGTLSGYTPGSTLSLVNNAGNKFALQGFQLVAGSTPTSFSTSPTETVVVQETLAGAQGSPKQTSFVINVANTAPSLVPLTLSNASVTSGAAANTVVGAIRGQTTGSTLSLSNTAGGKFAISGGNLVTGATPTNFATSATETVVIVETLAGATGSPKSTTLTITVTQSATVPALQVLTLSNNTVREASATGTVIGVVQNTTSGSSLALSNNAGGKVALQGTSLVCGAAAISYASTPTFTCTVVETLAGSPNSPKSTVLTISVQQTASGNILYGYPDANSTGYQASPRAPVTLTPVTNYTASTPNSVVSGLKVNGTITVTANNVTIRDCDVTATGSDRGIYFQWSTSGGKVEYCNVRCDAGGGLYGIVGPISMVQYCNIQGFEDPIAINSVSTTIQHNYIHDLLASGSSPHYDGIELDAPGGHTVYHNTVIYVQEQTSAVMLATDNGNNDNNLVDSNYLTGGNYTVYSNGPNNKVTNNYLGKGFYGYVHPGPNGQGTYSGNVELGDGPWPTPSSASGPGSTGSTGGTTPPTVTLATLTLSSTSVIGAAAAGTVVGSIGGKTNGSTLSLSADGGGRFAISGSNLVTTSTPTVAGNSYTVTIVETLTGAQGSPKSTSFSITAANVGTVTLWYPSTTPTDPESTDFGREGVNLATLIHMTANGSIRGVAFYRSSSSASTSVTVGVHRTDDGSNTLLAQKTASGLAVGWNVINFDTPVSALAGQEFEVNAFDVGVGGTVYYTDMGSILGSHVNSQPSATYYAFGSRYDYAAAYARATTDGGTVAYPVDPIVNPT